MIDESIKLLVAEMSLRESASDEAVTKLSEDLKVKLPKQYVEFLKYSNGAEGKIGESGYLLIWSVEEVKELNDGYNVAEFVSGFLLFGGDGGGELYAFDTRYNEMPIVNVPAICIDFDDVRFCGNTFAEFLTHVAS